MTKKTTTHPKARELRRRRENRAAAMKQVLGSTTAQGGHAAETVKETRPQLSE
jgi:hypothetical protein